MSETDTLLNALTTRTLGADDTPLVWKVNDSETIITTGSKTNIVKFLESLRPTEIKALTDAGFTPRIIKETAGGKRFRLVMAPPDFEMPPNHQEIEFTLPSEGEEEEEKEEDVDVDVSSTTLGDISSISESSNDELLQAINKIGADLGKIKEVSTKLGLPSPDEFKEVLKITTDFAPLRAQINLLLAQGRLPPAIYTVYKQAIDNKEFLQTPVTDRFIKKIPRARDVPRHASLSG